MAAINAYIDHTESTRMGELDERAQRRYVVTWFVECDSPDDGPVIAGNAIGVNLFDSYQVGNDLDLAARCKRITPKRISGSRVHWTVEVEYDSTLHETDKGERNPLARPPEVSWSTVQFTTIATVDVDGTPIVNTAREEFDPPPEKDDSRFALIIVRNEADFNTAQAAFYIDSINEDQFFGFEPGEAKCQRYDATLEYDNDTSFWRVTYEFHFRRNIENPGAILIDADGATITKANGWDLVTLNQGLMQLDASGNKKLCVDVDGNAVTQPVRLSDAGGQLLANTARTGSYFIVHQVYPSRNFATLNLP